MRILQVIPFFSPQMGGSAVIAYQLSKMLSERGHQVTVLTTDHAAAEQAFDSDNFEIVRLPNWIARWGFYVSPGIYRWLREHIRHFDLVHMHEVRTFQNVIVKRAAAAYGIPYVLSAHGTLPVIVQRKLAKRVFDALFGKALLRDASFLVAVSPVEAQQYRQAGIEEKRIRTIYNGLDLEEFAALPPRGEFRRQYGIPENARVVLYLGRLHRRKGIGYLISAFARLGCTHSDYLLLIAGPDEGELSRLQAMARSLGVQQQVRFLGPLYGGVKLAAYVDADVLASPSTHEIFGLVPFEALLCGLPVVVSDDCGAGQLIAEAQAGYLVRYGNVEELETALNQTFTARDMNNLRVRAGQNFIRKYLDWNVIEREMEVLYFQVIDASK